MSCIKSLVFASLLGLAACGGNIQEFDAGPTEGEEVTNAGGRMTGGTYTLDFQLGHPVDQGEANGETITVKGGAAVRR
jgi:hypothetical protein